VTSSVGSVCLSQSDMVARSGDTKSVDPELWIKTSAAIARRSSNVALLSWLAARECCYSSIAQQYPGVRFGVRVVLHIGVAGVVRPPSAVSISVRISGRVRFKKERLGLGDATSKNYGQAMQLAFRR